MARFFNRERFGTPQIIALLMLAALFGQCAWFVAYVPMTQMEANYVRLGLEYTSGRGPGGDVARSPLTSVVAALPLRALHWDAVAHQFDPFYLDSHRWLIRIPFLAAGLLLGASLWYVARRLYGDTGGYIALGLYAFNPAVVTRMSLAQPEILTAWGAFGAVFTAIAVAHTLYAPREVVLWNWRRILLLGFCILLMIGGQYSTLGVLVLALFFMLWAVPERRLAAITIWTAAFGVGLVLLFCGAFLFHPGAMFSGLASANWFHISQTLLTPLVYRMVGIYFLHEAPGPTLLFLIALITYAAWRRVRFFGNTAPLLVTALLLFLGVAMPGNVGYSFLFLSVPFLITFAAGVLTDLLESRRVGIALGVVMGVLLTQAVTSIMGLAHLSRSAR